MGPDGVVWCGLMLSRRVAFSGLVWFSSSKAVPVSSLRGIVYGYVL